ncbi:hypothetical protein CVT26_009983 [Gymnopilus dilepis]|uniref:phosphatidylinositol-3,4,5-trisphosphate 3-phosphatase n=1 Tax=Gymnopilus dilepis TaxID=231916 RepID=A0A409VL16_9AGAR|nr:hypothetical protein CVT26_009983 [Gymnopilus dilepis]
MTDYIRRLVSGNRARFKDNNLGLELDLTYVTDQVIIMGYPATGIEALYRNRRQDAKKFLEHRHGKNYWVFNFCPLKENSYDPEAFEGRVSRYPFPDHHAPPLALIPLAVREIRTWLQGSSDRVAVLHCKAGKGRSGTMACAYLLSLEDSPVPPKLERSYTAKEWAKRRMEDTLEIMPPDEEQHQAALAPKPQPEVQRQPSVQSDTEGLLDVDSGSPALPATSNPEKSFTDALKGVLDLHTARRMKALSGYNGGKVSQGVSIPSQRRFLYYWALLLAGEAPKHLWAVEPPQPQPQPRDGGKATPALPLQQSKAAHPKIRLTQLKIRMRETSGMKLSLLKAANLVIERTSLAKAPTFDDSQNNGNGNGNGKKKGDKSPPSPRIWASLARYDDGLVDLLEEWEAYTRDLSGKMGKRRPGSDHRKRGEGGNGEEEDVSTIFEGGKWDHGKMVKSFAHLAALNGEEGKVVDDKEGKIHIYTLHPLSDRRWESLKHDIQSPPTTSAHQKQTEEAQAHNADATGISRSEANSMYDVSSITTAQKEKMLTNMAFGSGLDHGVILDAGREVRVKLYMGQVFMGWFWFIPTFHMPQPPPTSASDTTPTKAHFTLARKDLDFALGIGSSIVDVDVEMEWVVPPSPLLTTDLETLTTEPQTLHTLAQVPAQGVPVDEALASFEPPLRRKTGDSLRGMEEEPVQTTLATAVQVLLDGGKEGGGSGAGGVREAVEAQQGAED